MARLLGLIFLTFLSSASIPLSMALIVSTHSFLAALASSVFFGLAVVEDLAPVAVFFAAGVRLVISLLARPFRRHLPYRMSRRCSR